MNVIRKLNFEILIIDPFMYIIVLISMKKKLSIQESHSVAKVLMNISLQCYSKTFSASVMFVSYRRKM